MTASSITALPDNLTVGGGLFLHGTAITALPDNLSVGGDLWLPDGRVCYSVAEARSRLEQTNPAAPSHTLFHALRTALRLA